MAYAYDYPSTTQYVYVNGILDVSNSSKGPYKGTTGDLTIGTNGVNAGKNYFDGCIDNVAYFSRAKNSSEVLDDATLTLAYSFENNLLDSGPLHINATSTSTVFVSSALSFQIDPSYLQASSLVLLGISNQAYSISLFIQPTITVSGIIVHISQSINGSGSWCTPFLGFTSAGQIAIQTMRMTSTPVTLLGPMISTGVWTHLAVTYSSISGLYLYVNGSVYSSISGPLNYTAANVPVTLTIGNSLTGSTTTTCMNNASFVFDQYYGMIDEFRLYSRQLRAVEVLSLANP